MSYTKSQDVIVYWYHLSSHSDVLSEGYIGVTNCPKRRHWEHVTGRGKCVHLYEAFLKYGADKILKDVVFSGTRDECFQEEIRLRPKPNIGWNIVSGGGITPSWKGKKHSSVTRAKMSASNKGKNLGRVSPFKGVTGRYSEKTLEAIGKAQRGKCISEWHKEQCRKKLSGAKSPHARFIALCHKDCPEKILIFGSIGEASRCLEIGRSALKSTVLHHRITFNRKGWKVLYSESHPKLGQL